MPSEFKQAIQDVLENVEKLKSPHAQFREIAPWIEFLSTIKDLPEDTLDEEPINSSIEEAMRKLGDKAYQNFLDTPEKFQEKYPEFDKEGIDPVKMTIQLALFYTQGSIEDRQETIQENERLKTTKPYSTNSRGHTLLMQIVKKNNLEMVEWILAKNKDILKEKAKSGSTTLMHAAYNTAANSKSILMLLLNQLLQESPETIRDIMQARDKQDNTFESLFKGTGKNQDKELNELFKSV